MRHLSSRWPPSLFPVAFHGHPDFLMWQMHGLLAACVLPCPTLRLLTVGYRNVLYSISFLRSKASSRVSNVWKWPRP